MPVSKEVQISNYLTQGKPKLSDFNFVVNDVPDLSANQILVKNLWMTVDPYMRGRMLGITTYIGPFDLNAALTGAAVGVVEESNNANYNKGDVVLSSNGWREYFLSDTTDLEKVTSPVEHLSYYLGVLGMPGLTAYGSLLNIGKPKEGETIFVSAAAGAVGSLVCQIAKIKGCKVIASAGSLDKINWLKNDLGVDSVLNYKEHNDLSLALKELAPNGIDIYYDNVGGDHLQAALDHMNLHGRVVMCGMISDYNNDKPSPGPNNLMNVVINRLTMQGFVVFDFENLKADFHKDMSTWLSEGKIKVQETCFDGIDKAPEAFISLFEGKNLGKMLVEL